MFSSTVNVFIVGFKSKDFFSINKQITIISIIVQTQANFCVCFSKINTRRFFSWTKASIDIETRPSPNIEKWSLQLLEWDNELLLTQKIITFLVMLLSKLQQPALSNVILYPLYTYFDLSLLFNILVAPNKQFLNLEFLGFVGQASQS